MSNQDVMPKLLDAQILLTKELDWVESDIINKGKTNVCLRVPIPHRKPEYISYEEGTYLTREGTSGPWNVSDSVEDAVGSVADSIKIAINYWNDQHSYPARYTSYLDAVDDFYGN